MLSKSFSLLFYLKKRGGQLTGDLPIYMRITLNGQRFELTTKRECKPDKWNPVSNRKNGKTEVVRELNKYLDILQAKAYEVHRLLIDSGKEFMATDFKNKLLGNSEKSIMLLQIFKEHNEKMEKLVGHDYARGTITRYKTSLSHTRDFIQWKYQKDDFEVNKLNFEFITEYEFYLKTERNCGHNTTMKYLANFKKVVLICVKNSWLDKDPFFAYKMHKHEVDRTALTQKELNVIINKKFVTNRLSQVRDIFIFCCYTGLAYADVYKLKRSEIVDGLDGGKWLLIKRQKTESRSSIPLLPTALDLLKRYENHPKCENEGQLLPVLTNQRMNAYLKEIADVCGIDKNITFHLARHTFATTITLSNGVPIESVSKMLGHKDLKTTQMYAKIVDLKISDDMNKLKELLGKRG